MRGSARAAAKVALLGSSITDSVRHACLAAASRERDWGEWGAAMRTLCRWAAAGLSTGHNGPPDSHPRHRSGAPPHRLGPDRGRRQPPDVHVACGSVATSDKVSLAERLVTIHDGLAKVVEEFTPGRGGGRGDLRQQGRQRDAQARPGARHRAADSGARGNCGRRIRAEPGEEDHRRRRPLREGADQADAARAAAEGRSADPRRRRRARHRGAHAHHRQSAMLKLKVAAR